MKRTYPAGPFIAAVEHALTYGLFDLGRLEALILKQIAVGLQPTDLIRGDFFALNGDDDA